MPMIDVVKLIEEKEDERPDGYFYHYTSLQAFQAIMQGMQLRLTRYDLMNKGDDEGEEAIRVASEILQKLEDRGEITSSLHHRIIDSFQSDSEEPFTHYFGCIGKFIPCTPYVICFTRIEADEVGEAEWLTGRDLRIKMRLNLDYFEVPTNPIIGFGQSNDRYGFCCIRTVDYGKESIRRRIERDICTQLKICKNRGDSEGCTCTAIRNLINEDRMFLHSGNYGFQKETRLVVYVPTNHKAVSGLDDFIHPRRVRNGSGELKYVTSDEDGRYIYLNLKNPLAELRADLIDNSVEVLETVQNAMNGVVKTPIVRTIDRVRKVH